MSRPVRLFTVAALLWCAAWTGGCATHDTSTATPAPLSAPPMGWNSWNSGIALSERSVEQTVDAMVASGMRDAGYRYVDLDAGWAAPTRDAAGRLQADPVRFPHGITALARYVHDRGMLLGIYHSPFDQGCGQDPRIGGAGHERDDAASFAAWGVDYLKYDWCRLAADHDEQVRLFTAMRDALRDTGRRIVYGINPNSSGDPSAGVRYDWSRIADVSRNGADLVPAWGDRALSAAGLAGVAQAFAAARLLAPRGGPAHVHDPDMLVVGIGFEEFARDHPTMALGPTRPDLSDVEQRAHFALWAMLAAPLLAGNDIRHMSADTRAILTNADVIAVDQDPAMSQARAMEADRRVLLKGLADGGVAVALFNPGDAPAVIGVDPNRIGLPPASRYRMRDLWTHDEGDLPATGPSSVLSRTVPAHGVALLRVWRP